MLTKMFKRIANNQDSLNVRFKLTMMFSDTGPMNMNIMLDDGTLTLDAGHDEFDGDFDVIDCNGLMQFKEFVETSDEDMAFILGCPQHDGELIQSIEIRWGREQVANARDQSRPANPDDFIQFRVRENSLMLFEVNNSLRNRPEVVWDHLCDIDPQLRSIGYLLVHPPCNNISHASSGAELTGSEKLHFYCIVKNGADIPRYGRAFAKRSWLHGHGRIEVTNTGKYLEHQIVNVAAFHPEQTMCESPAKLGDGLIQERPGTQLHAGGVLNTEILEDLNDIELLRYKCLVEEARNPS